MKKVLLPVLALVLSANAYHAMATNGTIIFTGKINSSTCDVTADSKNKTVYIGTYPTSNFDEIGAFTASKGFQISLTGCEAGDYSLRFEGKTVPNHFNLLSVSSDGAAGPAATGVGIEITDNNGKPFAIADGTDSSDDVPKATIGSDGTAVFNLKARYRSFEKPVKGGNANATSTFSIEYK